MAVHFRITVICKTFLAVKSKNKLNMECSKVDFPCSLKLLGVLFFRFYDTT